MKVNAIISDLIYVQAPDLLTRVEHPFFRAVRQQLTHDNPLVATLARLGKWTGKTDKYVVMFKDLASDGIYYQGVPRGFDEKLRRLATEHHVDLLWTDKTVYPPLEAPVAAPKGCLDDFQLTAVRNLLGFAHGCMEAPTGSGKTNMFMSMIPQLQTPTLILVHTKAILDQTYERLGAWLGVEPGIIGGGKFKLRDITVGMIQTLSRLDLKEKGIATRFGCVIVDECHHSPALTWAAILNKMQARYRYGFTATGWRKDRMEFVIWDVIGPIRSKVTRAQAVEAGRVIRPVIETVTTEYFFDMRNQLHVSAEKISVGEEIWTDTARCWSRVLAIRTIEGGRIQMVCGSWNPSFLPLDKVKVLRQDPSKWGKMVSDLTTDGKRNHLLEKTIRSLTTPQVKALVLTDRIEHANHLAKRLGDLSPALLTGDLTKTEREAAMARVRDGARLTIATIHLLGEGVDVPAWDLLFLVSPFSKGPRVLQALGRIARVAPGKDSATLIDFVDSRIPMLAAAARGRLSTYRRK